MPPLQGVPKIVCYCKGGNIMQKSHGAPESHGHVGTKKAPSNEQAHWPHTIFPAYDHTYTFVRLDQSPRIDNSIFSSFSGIMSAIAIVAVLALRDVLPALFSDQP